MCIITGCPEKMDITHNLDGKVLKEILRVGNGTDRPHRGCKVSIQYTGTLPDGTIFDKTGVDPFQFTLGKGGIKIILLF